MLYNVHYKIYEQKSGMVFIETTVFTEDVLDLLSDDEYAEFQKYPGENPLAGEVIQQTGGLRKIRWTAGGKGKRSGVRIIYYHLTTDFQIRLLLIYKKGVKDNLTEKEKKILRQINERW